jgi:hypothetical protein
VLWAKAKTLWAASNATNNFEIIFILLPTGFLNGGDNNKKLK